MAIAIARFNNFINDSPLEGAIDALKRIVRLLTTTSPLSGSRRYELPLTASVLAKTGNTTRLSRWAPLSVGAPRTSNMWRRS